MNNKGFTLIELLAAIVIIGIIGAISYNAVGSIINNSKISSEKIFVNKLSDVIDDYTDYAKLNNISFNKTLIEDVILQKCDDSENCRDVLLYHVMDSSSNNLTLRHLTDANLIDSNKVINPSTKKSCDLDSTIYLFQDSDYVYYYYIDLQEACGLNEEVKTINTIPDIACSDEFGKDYFDNINNKICKEDDIIE